MLAEAFVRLVEAGHGAADLWAASPRQILAMQDISGRLRRRRMAEDLSIGTMAARGEAKALKKMFSDLEK